jgi:hypothetical protein
MPSGLLFLNLHKQVGVGSVLLTSLREGMPAATIICDSRETNIGSKQWGRDAHRRCDIIISLQQLKVNITCHQRLKLHFFVFR